MFAVTPRGRVLPLDDSEKERPHLPAASNSKVPRLSFSQKGKTRWTLNVVPLLQFHYIGVGRLSTNLILSLIQSPDFGVTFGCRVFVASVNEEAGARGLSVGDTLLEVGGAPVEGMSLAKVERMVRQTKSKALSLLVEREADSLSLLPKVSNTEREGRMMKSESINSCTKSEDHVVTAERKKQSSYSREDSPSPWGRKLPCPSPHPLVGEGEPRVEAMEFSLRKNPYHLGLSYSKNILSGKDRL